MSESPAGPQSDMQNETADSKAHQEESPLAGTLSQRLDELRNDMSSALQTAGQDAVSSVLEAITAIDRARTQREILLALVEGAARFSSRAAFFLTRQDKARGWAAFGFGRSGPAIESLEVGYDSEPWSQLAGGGGAVKVDAAGCAALAEQLGVSSGEEGILIPFVLRGSLAGALYADRVSGDANLGVPSLLLLTHTAAQELETASIRRQMSPALRIREEADAGVAGMPLWQEPGADVSVPAPAVPEEAVAEPTAEEPPVVAEAPVVVEEPATEEPAVIAEAPVVEEPAIEEPSVIVEEPAVEEPSMVAEEPAVEEPSVIAEAPVVEEPAVEEPSVIVEEPAVEEPSVIVEEPTVEEPPAVAEISQDDPQEPETVTGWSAEPAPSPPSFEETPEPVAELETPSFEPQVDDLEEEPELEDTSADIWALEEDDEPTEVGVDAPAAVEAPPAPETFQPAPPVATPLVGQETVRLDVAALQGGQSPPAFDQGFQPPEEPAPVEPSYELELEPEAPAAVTPEPAVAEPVAAEPAVAEPVAAPEPAYQPPPAPEPPAVEIDTEEPTIISKAPLVDPRPTVRVAPQQPQQPMAESAGFVPPAQEPAPETPAGSTQVAPPEGLQGPGLAFTQSPEAVDPSQEDALHEEARRLARLLVSEIKLYNEEIIEEGRRNGDIYERLKDDIDRSRQMYEERIDPRLHGKEDYFRQELVQRLAGGDENLLGM